MNADLPTSNSTPHEQSRDGEDFLSVSRNPHRCERAVLAKETCLMVIRKGFGASCRRNSFGKMYKDDEEALFLELARSAYEDDDDEDGSCTAGGDTTCIFSDYTTSDDSSSGDDTQREEDISQGDKRARVRFGTVTIREFSSSSAPEFIHFPFSAENMATSGKQGRDLKPTMVRASRRLSNTDRYPGERLFP